MTIQDSNRFSLGSWTDRLPMTDQLDIVYGHPNRHAESKKLLTALVKVQSEQLEESKSMESLSRYAISEARFQHQESLRSIEQLSSNIVEALDQMEQALGGHLEGIRSVLGNVDEKLGEMLKVMISPLGTASAELTRGGNVALQSGFIDDAIYAFQAALEHKQTDYVTLNSLGMALIEKGDFESAIIAFRRSAAYTEELSGRADRAIAFENLARAYYVNTDFENAYRNSLRARDIFENRTPASEYRHVVYCVLSGELSEVRVLAKRLCETHPRYFLNFATDPDLETCRDHIIKVLGELAKRAHVAAMQTKNKSEITINENLRFLEAEFPEYSSEYDFVNPCLKTADEYLSRYAYSLSLLAKDIFLELVNVTPSLVSLCKSKREFHSHIVEDYEMTKREYDDSITDYRSQRSAFDSKSRTDLSSNADIVKRAKVTTWVLLGIGATGLLISGSVEFFKDANLILAIIVFPLMLAVMALIFYAIAGVVGAIVTGVVGALGKAKETSIKDRTLGVEYPRELEIKYEATQKAYIALRDIINQLQHSIEDSIIKLNRYSSKQIT